MKNKILIIILFIVSINIYSQSKIYQNGSLIYKLPIGWKNSNLIKKSLGISYGGTFFEKDEGIQFSVIEMKSPPNKSLESITDSDFKGAIKSIFHPNSIFDSNYEMRVLGKRKTKYLEAYAFVKGKKVWSQNYVIVYKDKILFIQGIIRSKNIIKSKERMKVIFSSIRFK